MIVNPWDFSERSFCVALFKWMLVCRAAVMRTLKRSSSRRPNQSDLPYFSNLCVSNLRIMGLLNWCSRQLSKAVNYRLKYPAEPQKFTRVFTVAVFVLILLWGAFITAVNVATVGYELVPTFSTTYNGSANLWYEKVLPDRWRPVTRYCEPASFPLGKSIHTMRLPLKFRPHHQCLWIIHLQPR
jgi:hypothetical protein